MLMSKRLPPACALLLVLVCRQHILQNVVLCAPTVVADESTALQASCNSTSAVQSCANIANIPYPFASQESSSCAVSSVFLLSNCSAHQAFWESFTTTLPQNDVHDGIIGPPAVMGIVRENYSTYINLTWSSDLMQPQYASSSAGQSLSPCIPPHSSKNLSQYSPASIDLTNFANFTFRVSSNSKYLLFNCSQSDQRFLTADSSNEDLLVNSSVCQSYQDKCPDLMEYYASPCIEVQPQNPYINSDLREYLTLEHAMSSLSCSHFQFFVTKSASEYDDSVTEWFPGVVQLEWVEKLCRNCQNSFGSCIFDSTYKTLQQCSCPAGSYYANADSDFPCNIYESSCTFKGRFSICHRRVKIYVSVGLAAIATVLLSAAMCCLLVRRRRQMKYHRSTKQQPPRKRAWARQESSDSMEFINELNLIELSERPMEYTYKFIESATSSFSSIVGEGGFGVVFKGVLAEQKGAHEHDSQEIAVKMLELRSRHSRKQFLNEVATIGRIHHVNVVRLLGFCVQEEHEMLVYEYVVNGSLDRWVFGQSQQANIDGKVPPQVLDWEQRYAIALGVARGLSYLHEECRHRIVHCDIKPQNILLDGQMCPKISDFGLARLMSRDESRVVTMAKGTPGYMAPEFWVGGDIQLSTKADVYSYGMVLLELISGRRNFALGFLRFPVLAFEAAMRGDFESLLSEHLVVSTSRSDNEGPTTDSNRGTGQKGLKKLTMLQQVRTAVFVALWCIQDHPSSRPCMSEVVQYLEGVTVVSEQPPQPSIAAASAAATPLHILHSNSNLSNLTPISGGR